MSSGAVIKQQHPTLTERAGKVWPGAEVLVFGDTFTLRRPGSPYDTDLGTTYASAAASLKALSNRGRNGVKSLVVGLALSITGLAALPPQNLWATFYTVTLTRVDQDLYKDENSGLHLKTRYCYEYVYWEKAVYSDDSQKITFKSGRQCEVAGVF